MCLAASCEVRNGDYSQRAARSQRLAAIPGAKARFGANIFIRRLQSVLVAQPCGALLLKTCPMKLTRWYSILISEMLMVLQHLRLSIRLQRIMPHMAERPKRFATSL